MLKFISLIDKSNFIQKSINLILQGKGAHEVRTCLFGQAWFCPNFDKNTKERMFCGAMAQCDVMFTAWGLTFHGTS